MNWDDRWSSQLLNQQKYIGKWHTESLPIVRWKKNGLKAEAQKHGTQVASGETFQNHFKGKTHLQRCQIIRFIPSQRIWCQRRWEKFWALLRPFWGNEWCWGIAKPQSGKYQLFSPKKETGWFCQSGKSGVSAPPPRGPLSPKLLSRFHNPPQCAELSIGMI